MKKNIPYVLVIFSALFFGCHKTKLPDEKSGDPVFYLNCNVNGIPVKLEAGKGDYYMNASSFYDTANSIYVFKGDLNQTTFNSGRGYALTVLINNYKATSSTYPVYPDSALMPGPYFYNNGNIDGLGQTVSFAPVNPEINGPSYSWTISDGNSSVDSFTSYSVTRTLDVGKTYSVSFKFDDNIGGCNMTHSNVFKVGNPLQTIITAESTNLTYNFSYTATGKKPYNCHWDFGDNSGPSSSYAPTHTFQSGNTYTTTLTLVDANGNTCTSYYQVNAGSSCQSNFTANFSPITNTRYYSKVTVLLTDPNGTVYSTSNFTQPSSSKFDLLKTENYELNTLNQPTKKVYIRFNCVLKNGNNSITIENGDAVIAVAYK